jgi:hypothetical protein
VVDTTHSPYMVDASRAHRVRAVEDVEGEGTRVHEGAGAASRDTVLHTLLVGGVADLGYLEAMSGYLRDGGRRGLDPEELASSGCCRSSAASPCTASPGCSPPWTSCSLGGCRRPTRC